MIEFFSETTFQLNQKETLSQWISSIISNEGFEEGDITYVFCDDNYLLKLNQEFLKHDTLTDIISFDNCLGKQINGDIFISIERVKENATLFKTTFLAELHRVMIHGIFHFCGYNDKSEEQIKLMRKKEDFALQKLLNA